MTTARWSGFGPVAWLTAQAMLFGAVAALLGIVANAMFLEAYGSGLLPLTYVVIGVAGVLISAAIRRGAQRFDLLRLAVAVLGGAAVLLVVSWLIARSPGGVWVSGPLLVLFPILIQLGFVFIGGQAGRVLDIAGIKASFPRIMAGFPIGAVLGGVAAVPLVDAFGRIEDLLLVTAAVQGGFVALVWATGRRYARLLELPPPTPGDTPADADRDREGVSLRGLLATPFIALLLAYQVLSAVGNQLADFLVFDRASALYPTGEELGRFVAGYTAVMNAVAIAFLFVLAGPLLRRYGLRIGIGANPLVGVAFAIAAAVTLAAAGPASVALLGLVSAARIADITLTDGMTRTSINALYQALPARQRLVVQATVEGMGVPIAIGVSGVLLLALSALPDALAARIAVFALVCAGWGWIAIRLYRAYGPALAAALRTRRLLDPDAALEATPADVAAARRLADDPDPQRARLGHELLAAVAIEASSAGLPSAPTPSARPPVAGAPESVQPDDATLESLVAHPDRAVGLLVLERIAGASPAPTAVGDALDTEVREDLEHAGHVLEAIIALAGEDALDADGVVRGALEDELALVARRVGAGVVARHGRDRLGAAIGQLAGGNGSALAAETLDITLGREQARAIEALLGTGLEPGERLARVRPLAAASSGRAPGAARSAAAWLAELAKDPDGRWRSPWLRACAIRALRLGGIRVDADDAGWADGTVGATAADGAVAEELALLAGSGS